MQVISPTGHTLDFVTQGRPEMVARRLAKGQLYEHELLNYTFQQIGTGGVFVDCGANIGTRSIFYAVCCTADKVYAIEPVPTNHKLLEENVRLNMDSDDYFSVPAAIGTPGL